MQIYLYTYKIIFYLSSIHSSMDAWIASMFWLLWTLLLWMNMDIQISLQLPALNFLGYTPRTGIAWSNSKSIFNFWGTAALFSTAAALFYIPTSSAWGSQFFPHACEPLFSVLFCFFITATLMDVRWRGLSFNARLGIGIDILRSWTQKRLKNLL